MNDKSKRNILFNRVQSVLDGCNPSVADEFRNYGNLAEKQIQERDATIDRLEKELEAARQQNGLFMYRLTDVIEEARHTQDTNPTMLEIMAIVTGKNDAEMIEKGIV